MNTPSPSRVAFVSPAPFPARLRLVLQTRHRLASFPLTPGGIASAFGPGFATGPHAPACFSLLWASGPPRHRPQLSAASLLTCVALLLLPNAANPPLQCQSSMPCQRSSPAAAFSAPCLSRIIFAPCRSLRRRSSTCSPPSPRLATWRRALLDDPRYGISAIALLLSHLIVACRSHERALS